MNRYRLELGIKVDECSERVTKCTEDDCRKALAARRSSAPAPPGCRLSARRQVWAQLCLGVAEQMGAGGPVSGVP